VGTANMKLDFRHLASGPDTALPGAGVADVGVDIFNMPLPVSSHCKALPTVLTLLKSPYLIMNSHDVL
jgi:hypothetical protein